MTYRNHSGQKVKFKIFDTDADKSKECIRKGTRLTIVVYYNISKAIIVLYDMTSSESFADTKFWIESVQSQCTHQPLLLLVGNKKDQKEKVTITKSMGLELGEKYGIAHFEVSANDQESVEGLLQYMTGEILDSSAQSPETSDKPCN